MGSVQGFSLMATMRVPATVILLTLALIGAPRQVQANDAVAFLKIGGTGSALGGMHLMAEVFNMAQADVHVAVLPSLGSGGGIKAVTAGKIDIAVSSRPLKESERGENLQASEYARTPIVFATRHDTSANGITLEQATAIYTDENPTWPDGSRLRLILRPATEADIELIRGFSPAMDKAVAAALKRPELYVAINDQDNATAIEEVPGSLGVTTLAQIMSENRRIKPLALNGLSGTVETLQSGEYPHAKTLFVIVSSQRTPAVDAFLRFMRSPEGQSILASSGHVVAGDAIGQDK